MVELLSVNNAKVTSDFKYIKRIRELKDIDRLRSDDDVFEHLRKIKRTQLETSCGERDAVQHENDLIFKGLIVQ